MGDNPFEPLMKVILTAFLALLLFACSNTKEQSSKSLKDSTNLANALLPEEEKRIVFKNMHYYTDSNDVTHINEIIDFENFYKEYYPYDSLKYKNYGRMAEWFYCIDEELINPQKPGNRKWFRLTVFPSFEFPFCITLEDKDSYFHLTYSVFGSTYSRRPDWTMFSQTTRTIDSAKCADYFTLLDKKDFLKKKQNKLDCGYTHAILFISEEINNGKYNKVEVELPWIYRCASADDYERIIECINLVKQSEIYPVLKKAFPPDKEDWYNPYEFFESILNTPREKPTE